MAADLLVTRSGAVFEQRAGQTTGQDLQVDSGASYRHRDGLTQFQSTTLGTGSSYGRWRGPHLRAVELQGNASLDIDSATVNTGVLADLPVSGSHAALTQGGGALGASALDL